MEAVYSFLLPSTLYSIDFRFVAFLDTTDGKWLVWVDSDQIISRVHRADTEEFLTAVPCVYKTLVAKTDPFAEWSQPDVLAHTVSESLAVCHQGHRSVGLVSGPIMAKISWVDFICFPLTEVKRSYFDPTFRFPLLSFRPRVGAISKLGQCKVWKL